MYEESAFTAVTIRVTEEVTSAFVAGVPVRDKVDEYVSESFGWNVSLETIDGVTDAVVVDPPPPPHPARMLSAMIQVIN